MKSDAIATDLSQHINEAECRFAEWEPRVRAFIPEDGRFERLHKQADALADAYQNPEKRSDLYGMLIGVKDIFQVAGFMTRAGSKLPVEVLQGQQARSVSRVMDAGALILGKTVTTEFAYFVPGPTRNPHNLEHTPGGSSSGSAAAVAVGLCEAALGTQTIGSIVRPAAFCGVVGVKPTYSRISTEGVIPLSPSLDHVGFFTRDVSTAQLLAPVLYESWDPATAAPRKPTLGIPEGPYLQSTSDGGLAFFLAACQALTAVGYELRRVPLMPDFHEIRARHDVILAAEVAGVHSKWFSEYEQLYAPKTAELIRRGQNISHDRLKIALDARERFRATLIELMNDNGIDVWLSPSAPGPAPRGLNSTGDPIMNLPWTQAGLPTVGLPAGESAEGLPLGLQLTGRWFGDEALLVWAQEIERIVGQV